ncbi:hypothetical protein BpHYR1_020881 [Brachionus plicatilis]|uniref:Uncharacterized protein n=1 Tax=Brachionus plicatilis TaxID=10195 RepID=A0A3M7S4J7_BRAPC|nr:hypothetical protein BpHYR1_020881 [Brachionus plicatilis]
MQKGRILKTSKSRCVVTWIENGVTRAKIVNKTKIIPCARWSSCCFSTKKILYNGLVQLPLLFLMIFGILWDKLICRTALLTYGIIFYLNGIFSNYLALENTNNLLRYWLPECKSYSVWTAFLVTNLDIFRFFGSSIGIFINGFLQTVVEGFGFFGQIKIFLAIFGLL